MWKTLMSVAAAAVVAVGAMTVTPKQAEAHCVGCWVGAGVVGGLALGALLTAPRYYGPGPYAAYYGPHCWWRSQRVWGPYGWGWRRVRVCR